MPRYRGLYGCKEGNESNPNSFQEHLADNAVVEGPHIAQLRSAARNHDWTAFQQKVQQLKAAKFAQARIDAMIASSMHGIKV